MWIEKSSEEDSGENYLTRYKKNPAIPGTEGNRLESVPGQWEEFREGSDCLEITLHSNSNRPGFKEGDYVDVEVLWIKDNDCSQTRP